MGAGGGVSRSRARSLVAVLSEYRSIYALGSFNCARDVLTVRCSPSVGRGGRSRR